MDAALLLKNYGSYGVKNLFNNPWSLSLSIYKEGIAKGS